MKKIYVVLSHTGTLLSRIIRLNTGAEYTHASIALDENLRKINQDKTIGIIICKQDNKYILDEIRDRNGGCQY